MKTDAAGLPGAMLARLDSLGLIRVSGAEAETFLQGQLSNDVRQLTLSRAQLSSYNSPKGRMLAVLRLFRGRDSIFLELHRSVLEATLKRLRMFVLRSKVILEDASTRRAALGLAGPDAAARLQEIGLPVPPAPLDLAWADEVAIIRRQGDNPRYTLSAPLERLNQLWSALAGKAAVTDADAWKLMEIEAGIPTIYPETSDHFVPQMCNLDALGGISFDKGCYTGQEIVARVHYRGAIKRRMSLIRTGGELPLPGSRIPLPQAGGSGEVVDAARYPDGHNAVLVVASDLAG